MARYPTIRRSWPSGARVLLAVALLLTLLGGAGLLPAPTAAATVTVTNGDDSGAGSLRAAIAAAAAGDTIAFDPSVTTVTLTSAQLAIGKNLTIEGTGIGGVTIQRSSAPGTPDFRLFLISGGVTVKLKGLTIRNGRGTNDGSGSGGGVRNHNSTLTVEDCIVTENQILYTDFYGGGLANHATAGGTATMSVINSTISGNSGVVGGGIANRAPGGTANLTVTGSTISGNDGTGVMNYIDGGGGTTTIADSTISGNKDATGMTGFGLFSIGTNGRTTTMNVTGSTISGNDSAGIVAYGAGNGTSTATITNSTIVGNKASGVYALEAAGSTSVTLNHATLLDNSFTGPGHQVRALTTTAGRTITIGYNRSVFGHSNASLTDYFGASGPGTETLTSGGFNVSQKDLPGAGGTDLANTDPQPDPAGLTSNGGATQTVPLLPTSPARNLIPFASCTQAADQRGLPRPQPAAGACDSGAVESQPTTLALAPDPAAGTYGGDVAVTATLTATTGGVPLANRTVEFFLNGVSQGTATTDAAGVAGKTIALGTTAVGAHTAPAQGLDATFAGDPLHLGSTDDATLQVTQASTSTSGVADQSIAEGTASLSVSATVQNSSNGAHLDGGTVTFAVKDGATILASSAAVPVSTGASAQTVSGSITLAPSSSFTPGSYTIEATYSGTTNFAGSSDTGILTVLAPTGLTLAPDPAGGTFGGSVAVTATLLAGSTPVPSKSIEFFLNGVSQGTATTDASGVASKTIALGTIPVGSYSPNSQGLRAVFAGDATHLTSEDTAIVRVYQANSSTEVQPATVDYGSPTVTLTATVTNASNGGSVDVGNVTFAIKQGATTLATGSGAVNPATGQATAILNLTPLANFPLGGYTIEASYGPTTNIGGSTDTAILEIVKAETRFATVVGETTYGNTTATLRARLVRASGNGGPVAGARVVFRLNGAVVCGGAGHPACPQTGTDGWATLTGIAIPPGLNGGSYPNAVRASFAGNGNYEATDQSGPLQVQRRILWVKPIDRTVGLRQPNPPTTPPANCLAQATATRACWLELTNGSAFLPGDNWSEINFANLRFAYSRTGSGPANEKVGATYRITALGALSANYDIRYQPGTLTVVAAP